MAYREGGGGYGWHSEMPPAQIGSTIIDPDEFPHVAHLLQNTHISNPGSSSNSTGYPEDGARHIYVGPNGSHYYTSDAPAPTAPYTGYNYIQAPEGAAPHPFAGIGRNPAESGYHGTGYFDNNAFAPPTSPISSPTFSTTYNYPPYTNLRFPQTGPTYVPQSPIPALPSYPPPPPSVSSSNTSGGRPDSLALTNRSFSYDDARLHDKIRSTYQQFMQGYEGRERYEIAPDGYALVNDNESDHHDGDRGRSGRRRGNSFYGYPDYPPAGALPRPGTKTPSHAESVPSRRPVTTMVHQNRPPNSRHSSSENGDESAYRHSGRYDKSDYNQARPKSAKSRPNSFSYNRNDPRPIDSEPAFTHYDTADPRSSSGSLGDGRYIGTPVPNSGRDGRFYRDANYGPTGGAIVHAPGRTGRGQRDSVIRSQPMIDPGYAYYQPPPEEFEEKRRRNRSKSRARAKTPAPADMPSSDYEGTWRAGGRTSASPPRRAKSRRRVDSPSPVRYRSKSRARSKARPEVHQQQAGLGDSPVRPTTPGPSRSKTPMPDSAGLRNATQAPEDVLRAREVEKEREMAEYERYKREYEEWAARESRTREKDDQDRKKRHKSRRRNGDAESASSDPSAGEKNRDKDYERDRDRKKDREKERDRNGDREKEKERRDKPREEPSTPTKKEEPSKPITDPALANPMIENLNPKRERAGVQPGQIFFRADLMCAMKNMGLCVVEDDPGDDHAHNQLLRLDCGHGHHEDCLRSMIASRERISMDSVDLEADKLWCELCRGVKGKKAGR